MPDTSESRPELTPPPTVRASSGLHWEAAAGATVHVPADGDRLLYR